MASTSTSTLSTEDKYVCGEGDDCPCHTREVTRLPLAAPPVLRPLKVSVTPGQTLYLCACGQSKNFPYCDGAHKAFNAEHGTSFKPIVYEATEAKDVWLCQCGHSKSRPFCDGAHKTVHKASSGSS